MRDEDTDGAIVENGEQLRDRRLGHPHDPRRPEGARSQQDRIYRHTVEGRVFLIDDDEIEAEITKHFGRVARRSLDERPQEDLAGQNRRRKSSGVGRKHA